MTSANFAGSSAFSLQNLTSWSIAVFCFSASARAAAAESSSQPAPRRRQAATRRLLLLIALLGLLLLLLVRGLVLLPVVEVLLALLLLLREELLEGLALLLRDLVRDLLDREEVDGEEARRALLALLEHRLLADVLVVPVVVLPGDLLQLLAGRILHDDAHVGDELEDRERLVVELVLLLDVLDR